MNKLWEYVGKFKKHGLKESLTIIWERKIDELLRRIILVFVKNNPLKNTIIIASHNDFDTNGGAFYDYLIEHEYNKQYKIVWLCRNPEYMPKNLPYNVVCYSWVTPNWRRDMDICTAKYFLADDWIQEKVRSEQVSVYCTHGAGGLKKVKGKIIIPDSVDYILIQSEKYAPIQAEQYSLPYPSSRLVYLGYPVHDVLYKKDKSELKKITNNSYNKVLVWMPTFRKHFNKMRVDGIKKQPLGIPLLNSMQEYTRLNEFLSKLGALLIIKIHPMQYIGDLKIFDMSNIVVLTACSAKEKKIDNYRLLRCTDALISDYSGVAYEYLQLDKPIGYVLDDEKEYKLGFVIEDIDRLMAGNKIYDYNDLCTFIKDVCDEKDHYKQERQQLRDYIYKYSDGKSCQRLATFLKL